jgi:hypothetical protein
MSTSELHQRILELHRQGLRGLGNGVGGTVRAANVGLNDRCHSLATTKLRSQIPVETI